MSVLSVKIPASLEEQLDWHARRRGVSKSAVVREALRSYFEQESEAEPASFLNRAQDLASIVDAEPDLSSNPAYTEGYGR